jgi:hemin uptake protein HemP
MTAEPDVPPPSELPPTAQPAGIRRVQLSAILGSDREIIICHRNEEYRLRLTSNNKLLLTK